MNKGRAEDGDLTYCVAYEGTNSVNQYTTLDKDVHNPTSLYTALDKTAVKSGNPEGPHPNVQPGSVQVPGRHVDTTEGSKKVNPLQLKIRRISPTYLILLLVTVVLHIAAGIAFIVAFVEISKL